MPRVGHIHGTELAMLRAIDAGAPPEWEHAEEWAERMRRWAGSCERLLVLSPVGVELVPELLGVEAERVVWSPNGFEPGAASSRGASAVTSGWRTGAAGWSRTPRAGTRRASPAAFATRRRR